MDRNFYLKGALKGHKGHKKRIKPSNNKVLGGNNHDNWRICNKVDKRRG